MTISDRSIDRVLLWLGVAAWAVTLGLTAMCLWLRVASQAPPLPNRFGMTDAGLVGFGFLQIACATAALLIVVRIPPNLVAWLLFGIGLSYAVATTCAAWVFGAAGGPGSAWLPHIAWLNQVAGLVPGVLTVLLIMVYPRALTSPGGTVMLVSTVLVFTVLGIIIPALHPGPLWFWPSIDNPFGVGPRPVADLGGGLAFQPVVLAMGWLVGGCWIVWRYRRSEPLERLQLKWFAAAALVSLAALGLVGVLGAIGQAKEAGSLSVLVYAVTGALVPIAVGIAILRYRLYAIDHLIDRAIAYGIVTAILVGLFALLVVALTAALEPITQGETVPVAAATIVVAALFQPVRRRVQRTIDRRFHRARYDAASTVDAFAERLRRTVDLGALEGELLAVVDGTVSPTASAVWVARGRGRAP